MLNLKVFPMIREVLTLFRKLPVMVVCLSTLLITGCSDGSETIVFENVSVIDAVDGYRSGQIVVVRENMIVEAGPAGRVRVPSGSTVIDGSGKYLIPGLWDAHVHVTNTRAMRNSMFPLFIVNGITYVRDTAATLESILSMRQDAEEASEASGMAPKVYMIGPHMDGPKLSWDSSVSAVTPVQARFIINCLINAGVDELKVYDLIPPAVALEVFAAGRELGYRVSSHVPLGMDVIEASNAGLSSMEHMYNLEMACSADWDSLLQARQRMIAEYTGESGNRLRQDIYRAQRLHAFRTQDEERRAEVLQTLARNDTYQVPTLAIVAQEEHRIFARDDYRDLFRYLPKTVRDDWEKSAERRSAQQQSEESMAHALWAYDMVPRIAEAGIRIMAGTDMPLAHLIPGFSLHEELELLVKKGGLTPMQALEAATMRPAEYLGLEHQQGQIGSGMLADLVLLDANPLEDITNTRRINSVMRDGHLHTREDLDRILSWLEEQ